MAAQRLFERSQAPAIGLAGAFQVTVEKSATDVFGQNGLPQVAAMQIGGLLHHAQSLDYIRRSDDPAHAHSWKRDFRKAVDLNDQIRTIQLLQRRDAFSAGAQPRVNVVFDQSALETARRSRAGGGVRRPAAWSRWDCENPG
jgi:hypothetical protein